MAILEHKRFSASGLSRDELCPGSRQFCESLDKEDLWREDPVYTRKGTAAHHIGEMVVTSHIPNSDGQRPPFQTLPRDYEGQTMEGIIVDDRLIEGVEVYTDYLIPRLHRFDEIAIEDMMDLRHTDFPFGKDTGGTPDFIGMVKHGPLFVFDYKNGVQLVEVYFLMQLLVYALCALLKYGYTYKFTKVVIGICQPNVYHPDGKIRLQRLSVDYVMNEFPKRLKKVILATQKKDAPLVPGDEQCFFCSGKAKCPAVGELAADTMMVEFQDAGAVFEPPAIPTLTQEQRYMILNNAELLIGFIKGIKEYEHARAMEGCTPPHHKLVKKMTHRRYVPPPDSREERQLGKELLRMGLRPAEYMAPLKLITPAKLESLMRKKGIPKDRVAHFFNEYVIQPNGGTNLVPETARGKPVDTVLSDFEEFGLLD